MGLIFKNSFCKADSFLHLGHCVNSLYEEWRGQKKKSLTLHKLRHMSLQVSTSWLRTGSNGHSSAVEIVSRWTGLENMRAHILKIGKNIHFIILDFGRGNF